ncbi:MULTISPECIES: hypothetical protein [Alphaproteobacteria]|nr:MULTISPECIES: hypothetical protein [Alphaproteobacteria]
MDLPDFFADVPTITMRDPVAVFLDAWERGVIAYTYADVVKLAGHSIAIRDRIILICRQIEVSC